MNSRSAVVLAISAMMVGLAGCERNPTTDFWLLAKSYHLVLHLSARPLVTPGREADVAPMVDSAIVILQVDSVKKDRAFGKYRGELQKFFVAFRSLGDSTFVLAKSGDLWTGTVSGAANDAGLELSGHQGVNVIRGTWRLRSSENTHGEFTIRPGA